MIRAYLCVLKLDTEQLHVCHLFSWWRHQMETFSALLAICAGNSPVPGEFPAKRPVTRSFDVFFDLRLNKRLSKQPGGWWFETLSRRLWRHRNVWQKSRCRSIIMGTVSGNLKSNGNPQIPLTSNAFILIYNWLNICDSSQAINCNIKLNVQNRSLTKKAYICWIYIMQLSDTSLKLCLTLMLNIVWIWR